MAAPQLRPRKTPRQPRSQATVRTILEAAARVLAKQSLAGFNTNRVAEVAGLSVGSLYQYFPNKAALVAALIEQAQGELADAVDRAVRATDGAPLATSIATLVRIAIEQQYGSTASRCSLRRSTTKSGACLYSVCWVLPSSVWSAA